VSLDGTYTCNTDGTGTVTWVITNGSQGNLIVDVQVMFIDGGPDIPLDFAPDPVPASGDSTATHQTAGTESGTATAEVDLLEGDFLIQLDADVDLEPCEQPLEPTTTVTAEPLSPAEAAAAVARQPAFTG
jgi:hypothetical protein